MVPRFACFIGWSNTGKTGFVSACAAMLDGRGVKAAALKCVRHGASFNIDGKDTTRFFEACGRSAVVSDAETLSIARTPPAWDRAYAASLFPEAEVFLVEGRILEGCVRVLVGGASTDAAGLKGELGDFDVLVTDHGDLAALAKAKGLAVFGSDQAEAFVSAYLLGERE